MQCVNINSYRNKYMYQLFALDIRIDISCLLKLTAHTDVGVFHIDINIQYTIEAVQTYSSPNQSILLIPISTQLSERQLLP